MKNIKNFLLGGILLTSLSMVSCEDYLDKTDESIISEDEAFSNFRNFQGYTEELYNGIVNFSNNYWTNSFNWGDDEIITTGGTFHFGYKVDQGNFWGWQVEHDGWGAGWLDAGDRWDLGNGDDTTPRSHRDLWRSAWYGIRKANIGLANMDLMTDATNEERDLIKGQLLFFRGWFHHRLMEYFGGLPYIDEVLPSDQALTLPRLSFHECADKAAADFAAAAELLPINWDDTGVGRNTLGQNDLRINKIMALSYLGKNFLWAGSPLMNYESTGSRTYNAEYCKKAAEAFGIVLNLVESGHTQYALLDFENYHRNFYSTGENWVLPGGTEAIFRAPYKSANQSNWGLSKQYLPSIVGGEDLKFNPTANYVNYFGMANGLPIENIAQANAESGYDPAYPWRDRDPRFYTNFIYDGLKVVQGSMDDDKDRHANLFTDGSYRSVSNGSRTGFVLRKLVPLTVNIHDRGFDYGFNLHISIPYMRLADVYLMYAEAVVMGYASPTASSDNFTRTAVSAVNVIRERAGAGLVASKFEASQEGFLSEIRRERAVELAFEAHRFNDLRRWLLLTERPYTLKTSLEFDRAEGFDLENPSENRVVNLRESVILERELSDKHYWLPLKVADVSLYPEFSQNPGW
ncbi:MAG: RagB/SusD family nutrient uptake outer membrane protein [Bacteroidales bacterium]|nr:RagB/SusD family nutrient uptake outer membrane protein [Bacteroidales bacterium]